MRTYDDYISTEPEAYPDPEEDEREDRCECAGEEHGSECPLFEPPVLCGIGEFDFDPWGGDE